MSTRYPSRPTEDQSGRSTGQALRDLVRALARQAAWEAFQRTELEEDANHADEPED